MNGIGIARKVDQLGRLVIPAELRRLLRIEEGTEMEMYADSRGIHIVVRDKALAALEAVQAAQEALAGATRNDFGEDAFGQITSALDQAEKALSRHVRRNR